MPDGSSTENVFANVKSIAQELENSWPGNSQIGRWNYRIAVSTWAMSVQPNGSTDTFDYFLIELNGQSSLEARGDRSVAGYSLYVGYNVPLQPPFKTVTGPFGIAMPVTQGPPDGLELIASSPDTSVASVSYTDTISQTVGGSIGFMGDSPTGSVSSSTTITNSTTRTVSDLRIVNLSGVEDNLTCQWQYIVTAGSLEAQGETPLLGQMLVRRPHSTDPLKIQVSVYAYFGNDGLDDSSDWQGLGQYIHAFNGDNLPPLEQGNARVAMLHDLAIDAPPTPKKA